MTISNIRMEDRIADRLKNEGLGSLIGEDDLLELTTRAVEIAFLKDRTEGTGYNEKKIPAPIFTIIQPYLDEYLKTVAQDFVDKQFKAVTESDEFQNMMGSLMVSALGATLNDLLKQSWNSQFYANMANHTDQLTTIVKMKIQNPGM